VGNKLYVGNLAYSVRDESLHESFSQFGTVTSAKVMMDRETGRSKGFGFVEMGSEAEAQAAINGMNGQPLEGDTELRDIADLVRVEIALFAEAAPIPFHLAGAVLENSRDHFQQRALATTRRTEDGGKMPARKLRSDFGEEILIIRSGANLEGEVYKFEHARRIGG